MARYIASVSRVDFDIGAIAISFFTLARIALSVALWAGFNIERAS
jgi:hypothetical protein